MYITRRRQKLADGAPVRFRVPGLFYPGCGARYLTDTGGADGPDVTDRLDSEAGVRLAPEYPEHSSVLVVR